MNLGSILGSDLAQNVLGIADEALSSISQNIQAKKLKEEEAKKLDFYNQVETSLNNRIAAFEQSKQFDRNPNMNVASAIMNTPDYPNNNINKPNPLTQTIGNTVVSTAIGQLFKKKEKPEVPVVNQVTMRKGGRFTNI